MANFNVKKKFISLSEIFSNIAAAITGVFVFIILVIFPLYTNDKYFDILAARYMFFKIWAIMFVLSLSLLGVIYLIVDYIKDEEEVPAAIKFLNRLTWPNIKKNVLISDIFMIMMVVVCLISTIGSEFKTESFYGSSGRFQGLECWMLYATTYFCITRTFRYKRIFLDFAIICGCIACIWGTMDFFMMDPFKFFVGVNAHQRSMFASSIGNLNTYTNYTIIVFAMSAILFMLEKNIIKLVFYGIATVIGAIGCVCGLADNAVLGIFALFLVIPFFMFKTRRDLLRYLIVFEIFFFSLFFFWNGLRYPHNAVQDSILKQLIHKPFIPYIFIPFGIIVIIIGILMYKTKPKFDMSINNCLTQLDSVLPKYAIKIYLGIVVLGFVLVFYIILDMNIFKKHVDIWSNIPSINQFVFNDDWGTHRGHNWRIAFTNFTQNFNLFQKLFGYGPDTYLVVTERTFYEEMVNRYGEVYDSAHNEYINYLICEGVIGLISYLGLFVSGIVYAVKSSKNNKIVLASVVAVICYMVQAIVNIAIPITTPIFFTLMYIGVADYYANRMKKVSENLNNAK